MSLDKINYWFFGTPMIAFGNKSLNYLKDIKGNRCFIVTDDFIAENLLHNVTDKLDEYGKEYKVFSDVQPDPKEKMVLKGLKECKAYQPDLVIAVGGGSSIDAGKAIWVLYERPDLDIDDMHPFMELGLGTKSQMVAIPTTSGTGAETTWAIVITRVREDGSEIKLELANREAVPNYAILDPVFTLGLPPKITASTAMDAMAHTFEGMIAKFRNDFSDGMAIKAIDLLREYAPIAYEDGKNLRAREAVHNAACMAGLSFGNSQVILGHSIGHALGSVFHKPHGLCVGSILVTILQFFANNPESNVAKEILAKAAKMLGIASWEDDDESCVNKLYEDLRNLMDSVDFPKSIKAMGIEKDEFEKRFDDVVDLVMESTSYTFGTREINKELIEKVLTYAYEGKDVDF